MNPPATIELGDVLVALGTAAVLIAIFALFLWTQKRVVIQTPVPLAAVPLAPGLDVGADRFSAFESRFDLRIGAIEQRQKTDELRIIATEHSVNNIRTALAALPSKDAVHRLEVDVTALGGKVAAIDATATATQRSVERIADFLMKGRDT